MIAVLHNIRSAHNVGSIFRTADAAGVEKMYLCGITPRPIDEYGQSDQRIAKVSLGAEREVAWEYCRSTLLCVRRLKKIGYTLIVLEQAPRAVSYRAVRLSENKWTRSALVVGNEVQGVPLRILSQADIIAQIPMHGKKESLNVSVAFGIMAFCLRGRL